MGEMDEWIAVAQFLTIASLAAVVIFIAIDKDESGEGGKKPREWLVIFLIIVFVVLPIWTWTLPDDVPDDVHHILSAYNNLKFIGTFLLVLFTSASAIACVEKYAREKWGFNILFMAINRFDSRSPRIRFEIVITFSFMLTVAWMVFTETERAVQFLYWVLGGFFGHLIIKYVPRAINHLRKDPYPVTYGHAHSWPRFI